MNTNQTKATLAALPTELQDEIISYVSDAELMVLRLSGRALKPVASRNLFEDLHINLDFSKITRPGGISLDLIRDTLIKHKGSTDHLGWVRRLRLNLYSSLCLAKGDPDLKEFAESYIRPFMDRMTRLEKIHIYMKLDSRDLPEEALNAVFDAVCALGNKVEVALHIKIEDGVLGEALGAALRSSRLLKAFQVGFRGSFLTDCLVEAVAATISNSPELELLNIAVGNSGLDIDKLLSLTVEPERGLRSLKDLAIQQSPFPALPEIIQRLQSLESLCLQRGKSTVEETSPEIWRLLQEYKIPVSSITVDRLDKTLLDYLAMERGDREPKIKDLTIWMPHTPWHGTNSKMLEQLADRLWRNTIPKLTTDGLKMLRVSLDHNCASEGGTTYSDSHRLFFNSLWSINKLDEALNDPSFRAYSLTYASLQVTVQNGNGGSDLPFVEDMLHTVSRLVSRSPRLETIEIQVVFLGQRYVREERPMVDISPIEQSVLRWTSDSAAAGALHDRIAFELGIYYQNILSYRGVLYGILNLAQQCFDQEQRMAKPMRVVSKRGKWIKHEG